MFSNEIKPKLSISFYCENCDYSTCKKSNYNNHLRSAKHKKSMFSNEIKPILSSKFTCHQCNKEYKDYSGLWRHKKKCNKENNENKENKEEKDVNQLVTYLMQENAEFKQLLIDQNKQIIELSKNAGNNNNNSFNLNFYLNETCKDALNIMDFVNQLQVGIKDLEETGRLGFADGISKIFINGLKQLDVSNRPVHCSDSKREILYIKNNNEWNKESEERTILTNAIKHVTHKNMKMIPEWTKENPDYNDSTSKTNDKYLKLVMNSMSGSTEEEQKKNINKIISNVAKEVVINK
jgi:hypothetical protein